MAIPVIPTLSVSKGFLTSNSDRAAYLLTFWIYNPGGVSDYYEGYNGSLRLLAYEYQQNRQQLAAAAKSQLTRIFRRHFPELTLSIDVDAEDRDGYRYALLINVMSAPISSDDYKPIVLSRSVLIDDEYRIYLRPVK